MSNRSMKVAGPRAKVAGLVAGLAMIAVAAGAGSAHAQAQQCDVVFSVSNTTDNLRALQLAVDYATAPGDFAVDVDCTLTPPGSLEASNDQDGQVLDLGYVDTSGFAGPSVFATCPFIGTTGTPVAGDFSVAVEDAIDESTPPAQASPFPTITVSVTNCVPAIVDCGNGVAQAGEECDDGNAVGGDGCSSQCLDTASCAASPRTGCLAGGGGKIKLKNDLASDAKDQGQYQWKKGAAIDFAELGDPVTGDTTYSWCVYDDGELVLGQDVPAGAGWAASGTTGYQFKGDADGISQIKVKSGAAGKTQVQVKAKSKAALFQSPSVAMEEPVVAQVVIENGACVETTFTGGVETETQYSAGYLAP
ncbi:MAG TPA: hypothetical protein VEC57_05105 [Candidatus Limnocylindrales bacterium]|nr:hypothetical protein [Candidatus Limnocylindrales bacterium]